MDIFESLENLPVSEACFEDIVNIVEEIINEFGYTKPLDRTSHITRVHGKDAWNENTGEPLNKSAELIGKAAVNHLKEFSSKNMNGKDRRRIVHNRETNKNSIGANETDSRRVSDIDPQERDGKEYSNFRVDKSIKRGAIKKLQSYTKGRRVNSVPTKDLSNKLEKLVPSNKSHPFNTKKGLGDFQTSQDQVMKKYDKAYSEGKPIEYSRDIELTRGTPSLKYTPYVKSIARNMKKSYKSN